MMQRCTVLALAIWTALAMLLSSCGPATTPGSERAVATPTQTSSTPSTSSPSATPKPAAETPRYGGILHVSHRGDPITYDPIQETSNQSVSLIMPAYSAIVQHDPLEPRKVIGDLAEKWEMSTDGLYYTFHFFKNVKWHDGKPLMAEDARFSLEVVRTPPKGVLSPRQEWLKAVDKIEAVDAGTLGIKLQYPSASFLDNLGDGRMAVIPKAIYEAKGNMKRDIMGTGPYKFKSFTPGASFSVIKNPDYFIPGRPYLDGITWYIILDESTRFAAFRTHRVHATPWASSGLTPPQAETVRKDLDGKAAVDKIPGLTFHTFWMFVGKAPWSDARVRKAAELTLDRQKTLKVAAQGVGDISGYMPPGFWSLPNEELAKMPGFRQSREADLAEAKRLMAEAGYANGFKTTTIARNAALYESAAISMKEQLAQIGIDINVGLKDSATAYDLLYAHNFETALFAGTAAYDDPDQVFGSNFVSGVPRNFAGMKDEQIDKWYDEQGRTIDPQKRKEIVLNMQRRMHDLLPALVLWWNVYEFGRWLEVKNLKGGIGVYNNLKFQDVWIGQ